ncbi:BAG family molecular chaperone regulator 6 [Euphorbia lathyris]|uniref:BAG family molecular chaperone regulator 6 n=1 Tax=Euphorbia lathyris TaxID=212925 RepID=UPI0033136B9A
MMPIHRYMDSYPHPGNQISSGQNYYPSFEAVPPLTKVDPSKTVVMNQPWLYPNSFNHSIPCYPCSNGGHFPGYYSHGFYPHSPAPQFNCCGHHSTFPGAFPVQYMPPPCYLKELPKYDYDKPRDYGYHCCGCPNHSHYQKYGGGERMEEEEPNAGSKFGHAKVPFQLENYPYPVLWMPPEYMKNKEHKKPLESDGVTQEKSSQDMKPPQNVKPNEQEPKEQHSWFPLDMKSLQPLLQGREGRRTQDQQDEERMRQFPFPIIWMPPHHKQEEDEKEEQGNMNGSPTTVKDPVPSSNVFPVKFINNGNGTCKVREIDENVSDQVNSELKEESTNQRSIPVKQMEEKSTNKRSIPVKQMEEKSANQRIIPVKQMEEKTNQRIIPVKQMEVFKEGENSEGAERRGRTVSPKKRGDHETGKSSGAGARRDSSSPPKSKLPPVCLRVDPLPRKKSSSLSSRSPSPPGSTGKSQERTKEALKLPVMLDRKAQACQDSEVKENTLSSNKEAEEKKSKGAAIQVAERKRDENKDEEPRNDSETGIPVCSSVDSINQTTEQSEKNDVKFINQGEKGLESSDESTIKQANEKQETNDESRSMDAAIGDNKKLSVNGAACRIQSAYRGYQVRKWEPLKKLKQIAEVQEQMIELRKKIHGLESSLDLQKDEKQTIVIGEMIMRLLLKLDTIQGLHPSLRNARKSLARELVMLQEKLDLLVKANSNEKPSDSEEGKSRNAREHPTDDIPQLVNAVLNNQDEETSKSPLVLNDEQRESVNDAQLVARDIEFPSDESKGELDDGELDSIVVLEHDEAANARTSQLPSQKSGSEEMFGAQLESICPESDPGAHVVEVLTALPVGVIENEEPLQHGQAGLLENQAQHESDTAAEAVEVLNELPVGVIENEEPLQLEQAELQENQAQHESDTTAQAVVVLNELPVGVIENEEPLQLEQAELQENQAQHESDTAAQAVVVPNELPVGVIENEEPLQLEQAELQENALLLGGDVGEKAAIDALEWQSRKDTSSELEEVSDLNEVKQQATLVLNAKPTGPFSQNYPDHQFIEGFDEDTPVKVEIEDTNFPGKAMLGGDGQQTQVSEISNIVQMSESLQEETLQASPLLSEKDGDEMKQDVDQGMINVDVSSIPDKTGDDQDSVYQATGEHASEGILLEKRALHLHEQETVGVPDMSSYQLVDRPDTSNDEGKRESLPLLTATGELSTREQEIALEDGKKLVEENEKMRKMVEKLVECGREQLAAISNLTGRVNDLEKRLRRKKMKARRCRRAVSNEGKTV